MRSPFAATGGDGVHFSLLLLDGELSPQSPVVMTVPPVEMSIVLGADVDEFFGLGISRGYTRMEYLVYDNQADIDLYLVLLR